MRSVEGIVSKRGILRNSIDALRQGALTVGFLGGSITDGRPGHNWPEPVARWLADSYPHARISIENGGIGATGSGLGAFRAKRDIIDRGCHLVFVEYAVNDQGEPTELRNRTREGLLRQLLEDGSRDVVLSYTYSQEMYEAMARGEMPATIAELEQLAEHYGLSSVWMGKHALEEVKRGLMRWEEWLPDGLHPTERGSLSYGESVISYLKPALQEELDGETVRRSLPEPLDADHWQHVSFVPFEKVRTEGSWLVKRGVNLQWIDRTLSTSAVGAKLAFEFEGTGLALAFDFGKLSSEFRYRIDGGEWQEMVRPRPDWCGPSGWLKLEILVRDLPQGVHKAELEVTHGNRPDCGGTRFDLAFIGAIRISQAD